MKRNASAVWEGALKEGRGSLSSESGVLAATPYSFGTRFEEDKGTNPEELLGAALAGCYSMALSLVLGESGITPERIETRADVTLQPDGEGFSITGVHLDTHIRAPGADKSRVATAAEQAKLGCPVSKLFNVEISLAVRIET